MEAIVLVKILECLERIEAMLVEALQDEEDEQIERSLDGNVVAKARDQNEPL